MLEGVYLVSGGVDCTSFLCLVNGQMICLRDYKQCDGTVDCDDQSDEAGCKKQFILQDLLVK